MPKHDLLLSLGAALVIGLSLLPTLINTGLYNQVPFLPVLLFLGLPVLVAIGMFVAYFLGRRLAILWQLAKFALVGVLNTAIDFGVLNFLINVSGITSGIGIIFINITSFSLAIINSFFWNKQWVFGEGKQGNFVTFAIVTFIGLSLNTGIVYLLTTFVDPIIVTSDALWANLAKVLATGISMVWNFMGYKMLVFSRTRK